MLVLNRLFLFVHQDSDSYLASEGQAGHPSPGQAGCSLYSCHLQQQGSAAGTDFWGIQLFHLSNRMIFTSPRLHIKYVAPSFKHFVIFPFFVLMYSHRLFLHLQPLSRSLNADVPEQLITPLVSLGHISMLAPDQFASPMKSIVANFIVKDLLMNDRVSGDPYM